MTASATSEPLNRHNAEAGKEWYEFLLDGGYLPDFLLRRGIRFLLCSRLNQWESLSFEEQQAGKMKFIEGIKNAPIAIETDKANEQHYEVPTEFIQMCLGRRMKYSCCLFPETAPASLDRAEELMMELYCERAQISDGQSILELGAGWGSLCLYLAERYPRSRVTSISNSRTQKLYIDEQAKTRNLKNLTVITCDVQKFETGDKFDRIVSIEMLEHMKNYQSLFKNVSSWLSDDGLFFCHVFSHKSTAYHFETGESNSWMARYFFTGGTMPSHDLFLYFQDHMSVKQHWFLNGTHYAKTSEEWLKLLDKNKDSAIAALKNTYPTEQEAKVWFQRWRIFYLAVAELFNYRNGNEWGVSHFLFSKK